MFDDKHLHIDKGDHVVGDWLGALAACAKNGSIKVYLEEEPALDVIVDNDKIAVNLLHAEFFKTPSDETGLFDKLKTAKEFSRKLSDSGLTISFSRKGKEAVTLGKDAKPTLSRLVTRSGDIQLNSVREFANLKKDLKAD